MISMYIDESGSIHPTSQKLNRYFVIGIVIPNDSKKPNDQRIKTGKYIKGKA